MNAAPPRQASTGQQVAAREAFCRALDREAHNLQQRPDLVWQQISNRL